jgi:WD40 repeat protein
MSDLITSSNVLTLRRAFERADNEELTIEQFVTVMTRVVLLARVKRRGGERPTHAEEITFAVDMVELFKQIDVNGNGLLEWSEFTAYIVEAGRMLENKETLALRQTTEAGFFVGERESRYAHHAAQITNVERGHRDEHEIIREGGIVPLGAPFHCLAVLTKRSDVIRLFALPMRPGQQGFNQYKPQTLRHHTQFRAHRALGITHIPRLSVGVEGEARAYIVSSSVDDQHGTGCFISIWSRTKRSLKVVVRVSTHNVIDQLTWCSANDTLYAGSSTHTSTIEAWKLVIEPKKSVSGEDVFKLDAQRVASMRWHSSSITRLRYLPDNVDPLIASFSKDGTVCFWSTHTNRAVSNQNIHNRGVRGVAHSIKLRLCVTVGYGNICFPDTLVADVWRIKHGGSDSSQSHSSSGKRQMLEQIATLEGHEHPIVDVVIHEFPDDLAHIVTIDERGHLRRWCAHHFTCLQSFDVPETIHGGEARCIPGHHVGELHAIAPVMLKWRDKNTHEPPHPGIVVASGSSLGVVESLPVHHANKPLIAAKFNPVSMTFLTVSARSMRIWDALTGQVLRIYHEDLLFGKGGAGSIGNDGSSGSGGAGGGGGGGAHRDANAEFTCCALDDRMRKIITGDNKGRTCVWNYLNGALMKVLDPHKKDISSLCYAHQEKLVLSTAWDGTIFVNDELDNDGWNPAARRSVLMRDVHVQQQKIKTFGATTAAEPPATSDSRGATPSGKHLQIDIGGVTLSNTFGLFVTASHIGADLVINCWDLEYMRLLGSMHCPKRVVPEEKTEVAEEEEEEEEGEEPRPQKDTERKTVRKDDTANKKNDEEKTSSGHQNAGTKPARNLTKMKAMQSPLRIQTRGRLDRSTMPPPRMPATSPLHSPTPLAPALSHNRHGNTAPHNEIMAICFLEPWLGLCFSDDSGHIFLCNIPSTHKKFTCVGALLAQSASAPASAVSRSSSSSPQGQALGGDIVGTKEQNELTTHSSVHSLCCRLSPCGNHLHLFAGHEDGRVRQWELTSDFFEHTLGIRRPKRYGYKQPNFNGRRSLRYGTYRARELLPSRSQRGGFEVPLIPSDIMNPVKIWQAHNLNSGADHPGRDAVIGLQLIEQPNAILATSQNGTATIWGLDPRPTKAEELERHEASLSKDALRDFRAHRRAKRERLRKEMWLAGMTEDEIRQANAAKHGAEEKEESIEREKPMLLGVLDPDINRSTPDWKFSLDIAQRERDQILEARRVLHDAAEIERAEKRDAERQHLAALNLLEVEDNDVAAASAAVAAANARQKRTNQHDYPGHDFVEQALARAFERPSSTLARVRMSKNRRGKAEDKAIVEEEIEDFENSDSRGALSPGNHDFSSRSSGLTADMLAGRSGGGGQVEIMAWRRKAAAVKKKNRGRTSAPGGLLPKVRGASSSSNSSSSSMASIGNFRARSSVSTSIKAYQKSGDLRASILAQLGSRGRQKQQRQLGIASAHGGYVPKTAPGGKSPSVWFEFSGSRSTVPKVRHFKPPASVSSLGSTAAADGTLRNDGWDNAGEAMSDTLSVIADAVEDLEDFYIKRMDPADEWIDKSMSTFASSVNRSLREERRNPTDNVTGVPKGMGVTETIFRRKQASRAGSLSNHGRKMRVHSGV